MLDAVESGLDLHFLHKLTFRWVSSSQLLSAELASFYCTDVIVLHIKQVEGNAPLSHVIKRKMRLAADEQNGSQFCFCKLVLMVFSTVTLKVTVTCKGLSDISKWTSCNCNSSHVTLVTHVAYGTLGLLLFLIIISRLSIFKFSRLTIFLQLNSAWVKYSNRKLRYFQQMKLI